MAYVKSKSRLISG